MKTALQGALALLLMLAGPLAGGTMKSANELLSQGKHAEAAAAFEALGKQASGKTEGWRLNNWGLALFRMDKAGDAGSVLEKAVQADPKNFTAWANLAAAYERIGDKVKAIDTYRRALELLKSENAALATGRKIKDQEAANNAAASESVTAGTFQEPASKMKSAELEAALKKARELMDAAEYAQAAAIYATIGATSPAKREGWKLNNWGLAFIRQGDHPQALPRLQKSVEVYPDNPTAWNNLGVVLENLGRTEEARQAYARAATAGKADADQAKAELNQLKLDFNAEKKRWEASR